MVDADLQKRIDTVKEIGNIPQHVAIIMDGNGRWANERGLDRTDGHKEGINSVREIVQIAGELGVKVLTLYTFSSENWKRPKREVSALMTLLLTTIKGEVDELDAQNVRLTTIGDIDMLPTAPRLGFQASIKRLSKNTGLVLNLALSYSSRAEIVTATKKIAQKVKENKLDIDEIDDNVFSEHLYTSFIQDPDLLVRTSGELRLSNFLLWQIAYTEIYITKTFWPDFRKPDFLEAISAYQNRERRFGRVL